MSDRQREEFREQTMSEQEYIARAKQREAVLQQRAADSAFAGGIAGAGVAGQAGYATPSDRDPWVNRSEGMRCRTCVYFVVKQRMEPVLRSLDAQMTRGELGRCRRHAPTMSGYPAVYQGDWCGDHKLDENKA